MGRFPSFEESVSMSGWRRKDGTVVRDECPDHSAIHHRKLRELLSEVMATNEHISSEDLTSHFCAWVLSLYKRDANTNITFSFEPPKCEPVISDKAKHLIDYFESLRWDKFDQRIFGDIWMGFLSKEKRGELGVEFT